jgi:two-component system, cell cycle response regulator
VCESPFRITVRGHELSVEVTISAGVAQLKAGTESAEALVAEADRHLYAAKNAGRNRVVSAISSAT